MGSGEFDSAFAALAMHSHCDDAVNAEGLGAEQQERVAAFDIADQ